MLSLSKVKNGKIIPRSYPSIGHMPGSKMISDEDKLIGADLNKYLIERRHKQSDLVIVTEKVDGSNVAVYREDNVLYPLVRRGYDCRTAPYEWLQDFAKYVKDNEDRFNILLDVGERICGEWMVKTHTLTYNMKHEPFIVFDIISGNSRLRYFNMRTICNRVGFPTAGLVHAGESIPVDMALKLLGKGYHGVAGGKPEGVVYRYENDNGYWFSAKYVSNQLMGNDEVFNANRDKYNRWKPFERMK